MTTSTVAVTTSPALRSVPACAPEHDDMARPPSARFTVTGGPGGTTAHVEDLERAAATLDRAAQHLDEAAAYGQQLLHLVEQAGPWSPHTTGWARDSVVPLCSRWSGIAARAERARATARHLRATAELYRQTDRAVSDELRHTINAAGHAVGERGPFAWLGLGALAAVVGLQAVITVLTVRALRQSPTPLGLMMRLADSRTESARRRAQGPLGFVARTLGGPGLLPEGLGYPSGSTLELLMPGVASAVLSAAPGRQPLEPRPVVGAARMLGRFADLGTRVLGTPKHGLVVAPMVVAAGGRGSAAYNPPPPRDAADVLDQVKELYPVATPPGVDAAGGPPGTVGVQRLDHPDGNRAWVVTIPGTETWSPLSGPNPMDLRTNLDIMGGRPNDVSELVTEAMRAAGIPPDEPVLLAGHSQGGMVAAQLAQDPAIQQRYSIDAVLTAGSAVATLGGELPPGTLEMHLESSQDLVWGTDGAPNVDDPQRITVRGDLAASAHAADRSAALTPLGAHDVAAYARMARDVGALDDPSVEAFTDRLAAILGGPGTTASTRFYQGVRVP